MQCEKVTYPSRKKAWKGGVAYVFIQYGNVTRPYRCPKCRKYHLTSQKTASSFAPDELFVTLEEYFGFKIPTAPTHPKEIV